MGVRWDVVQAVDSNRHTHAYKNILQHMNDSGLDASLERFLSYLVPEPYWYMRQLPKQTVLEDLALFKLPRSVDSNYRVESFQPTMLTLLSRWLSSPPDKSSAADRALLLLRPLVWLCRHNPMTLRSALGVSGWSIRSNIVKALDKRLGKAAWSWIARQLQTGRLAGNSESALSEIPAIWMKAVGAIATNDDKATGIGLLEPSEIDLYGVR